MGKVTSFGKIWNAWQRRLQKKRNLIQANIELSVDEMQIRISE
jgi:hypothetical protein